MKDLLLNLIKKLNDDIWNKEQDCNEEAEHAFWAARDALIKVDEHVRTALRRELNEEKGEEK